MIVASCFIAKASYEYWYNAAKYENHNWHDFLVPEGERVPPWLANAWKAVKNAVSVAACDTFGYIIGPNGL